MIPLHQYPDLNIQLWRQCWSGFLWRLLPPANEVVGLEGDVFTGVCPSVILSTRGAPCDHHPWCIGTWGLSPHPDTRHGIHTPPPATDIWWPLLETCPNLYWLVLTSSGGHRNLVSKLAVRNLLECFLITRASIWIKCSFKRKRETNSWRRIFDKLRCSSITSFIRFSKLLAFSLFEVKHKYGYQTYDNYVVFGK